MIFSQKLQLRFLLCLLGRQSTNFSCMGFPHLGHIWILFVLPPPPLYTLPESHRYYCSGNDDCAPLYKLRPCPSYSTRRDRINLAPNLIRYKCSAAT